jgi:hypothetical protein
MEVNVPRIPNREWNQGVRRIQPLAPHDTVSDNLRSTWDVNRSVRDTRPVLILTDDHTDTDLSENNGWDCGDAA